MCHIVFCTDLCLWPRKLRTFFYEINHFYYNSKALTKRSGLPVRIFIGYSHRLLSYIFPCRMVNFGTVLSKRYAMAQLVEALRYKPEGRRFDFLMALLEFCIDIILRTGL